MKNIIGKIMLLKYRHITYYAKEHTGGKNIDFFPLGINLNVGQISFWTNINAEVIYLNSVFQYL